MADPGRFSKAVCSHGFAVTPLARDFPRVRPALRELTAILQDTACDVLLCHGYKAHMLGRMAARRVGIPAVAVSRGWTGESRRVKFYEWLDRRHLLLMDHVVCVSEGQAAKVRRWCRVPAERLSVIRNRARLNTVEKPTPRRGPAYSLSSQAKWPESSSRLVGSVQKRASTC